jgi:hypothetical protein
MSDAIAGGDDDDGDDDGLLKGFLNEDPRARARELL